MCNLHPAAAQARSAGVGEDWSPFPGMLGLNPTAAGPSLFRFWLQVRPSSLATAPIRPSCHLSGCQLIIMILMIFQLDSALNPDQGYGRFPIRPHHRKAGPGEASLAYRSAWRGSTFHIHWAQGPDLPHTLWATPPPAGTGSCDSSTHHKRAAPLRGFQPSCHCVSRRQDPLSQTS